MTTAENHRVALSQKFAYAVSAIGNNLPATLILYYV